MYPYWTSSVALILAPELEHKTLIEVTKNTVSRTANNTKSTAYLIEK